MSDKPAIKSSLLDYHCMIKVKGAMDQFAEGLEELRVLQLIKRFPALTKPLFVSTNQVLTAGQPFINLQCVIRILLRRRL